MEIEKKLLNYEKNLWLGFKTINLNFKEERNIGKILLYIFTQKKNLECEYANGINQLYEMFYTYYNNNNQNKSSLKLGIDSLLNEIVNESNIHLDNVNNIDDNVLKPFGILLENQLKKGIELADKIYLTQNNFKKVVEHLKNIQSKFQSATKYAEMSIISYEKEKYYSNNENNINNENEENHFNNKKKAFDKYDDKQKKFLLMAKDYEKQYKDYIIEANNEREKYIKSSIEVYNSIQEMDESYINELKKYFIKITQCYIEMYNRLFDSKKNTIKLFNKINSSEDIEKFINENKTNYSYPSKFEFIPYTPEFQLKIGNGIKEKEEYEIGNKALSIMNDIFKYIPDEFKDNPEMENNFFKIEEIVKNIWKGENIENEKLFKLFDYSIYRMQFLYNVNRFRTEGLFFLQKNSFYNLCSIMNYLLSKSYEQKDYQSIKFCMILSQTFFLGKEKNCLVQDEIQKNNIFKNETIWEGLIDYSLNEEINNQNNYCNYFDEDKESREKRIHSLCYINLITFWYNMKIFGLPIQNCKNVIRKYAEKYQINENDIFTCEATNNEIKEEIISTSIEDNIENIDLTNL